MVINLKPLNILIYTSKEGEAMFHIEHVPIVHDRSNHSAGNGGKRGKSAGHERKYNNKGVFFAMGMGCHRHNNCFTCPFEDCHFQVSKKNKSARFMNSQPHNMDIGGM